MVKPNAFTTAYPGISNVLESKVTVGHAFRPSLSPVPTQIEFKAIWDTGASNSVISKRVVQKCGLKPTGMTRVSTAGGIFNLNTYFVSIGLPHGVGFPLVRVTEGELESEDLLLGMDLIAAGDFAVTSYQGKTVFTYRTPSSSTIDFVKEANRLGRLKSSKVGRNEPCPCGSGKKYKKCHGA